MRMMCVCTYSYRILWKATKRGFTYSTPENRVVFLHFCLWNIFSPRFPPLFPTYHHQHHHACSQACVPARAYYNFFPSASAAATLHEILIHMLMCKETGVVYNFPFFFSSSSSPLIHLISLAFSRKIRWNEIDVCAENDENILFISLYTLYGTKEPVSCITLGTTIFCVLVIQTRLPPVFTLFFSIFSSWYIYAFYYYSLPCSLPCSLSSHQAQ